MHINRDRNISLRSFTRVISQARRLPVEFWPWELYPGCKHILGSDSSKPVLSQRYTQSLFNKVEGSGFRA